MNHGPDSSTTAWSSQVWFLRLVYNRNACDSREAEFNRKPVKVTIQTLRLFAHPFLTSLLLKLASGVFSHQTWVLLRWTKTELNRNLSTCAENQSLLQSLQTAALLARCKFCFQWTKKWNSNENLWMTKSWDMYSGSQRPQEMVLNICSAVWCILS